MNDERKKYIVILRGLPGSGKSTWAKRIARTWCKLNFHKSKNDNMPRYTEFTLPTIVSADFYFIRPDGYYDFNPKLLKQAHQWCVNKAEEGFMSGNNPIIIDNTNTRHWEFEKYAALAKKYGYAIKEKVIGKIDKESVKLYAERNTHNVPVEKIAQMADRFEW